MIIFFRSTPKFSHNHYGFLFIQRRETQHRYKVCYFTKYPYNIIINTRSAQFAYYSCTGRAGNKFRTLRINTRPPEIDFSGIFFFFGFYTSKPRVKNNLNFSIYIFPSCRWNESADEYNRFHGNPRWTYARIHAEITIWTRNRCKKKKKINKNA